MKEINSVNEHIYSNFSPNFTRFVIIPLIPYQSVRK